MENSNIVSHKELMKQYHGDRKLAMQSKGKPRITYQVPRSMDQVMP